MSRHEQPAAQPTFRQYLAGAALGAFATVTTAALVMMLLGNADAMIVARRAGSRFIAYVVMIAGGLAGAALVPGVVAGRAARQARIPHVTEGEQYLPLAVLGGAMMGIAALGIALSAARMIERVVRLVLALTAPSLIALAAWLSIFVTLCGVVLFAHQAIRLLDGAIRLSRASAKAAAMNAAAAPEVAAEHVGALLVSRKIDSVIRIGLGAITAFGLALRVASLALESMGSGSGYPFLSEPPSVPRTAVRVAAILAIIGGGAVGLALDRYFKARALRPIVPLGAWYGHTPVAWAGGILAAKLLAGVAFALAALVFLPMDGVSWRLVEFWPFKLSFLFVGISFTFVMGRSVARWIDGVIIRERSIRLPRDA